MQANPMRSLYGFAKQREEEANGLTQILGQVLGQNADLSGNQQQQQQPVVQDALFRTPPGSDQTPFKAQNMPYLTPPGSDQTPFVPQLLQASALAQTAAQPRTDAPDAQPEAVDAATAPLMAPRAAAPENAKSTIESILAGLGENPEDAAKKAKNMSQGEMWLALGKGIGQIGKGQAVDISSVVQMRQQRLATSAAETKDVARRRAAASLVFEQSGDASMATAVGKGAISYSDFTTERQRKEVNARANAALVKEAQKNNLMAEIVGDMDFLSPEQRKLYAKATEAGVDLTTLMKPYELEQAADAAALATAKLEEKAQQRDGAQKFYKESSVPVDQATARYLEQTDMSVKEARELALKEFPVDKPDDLTTTRKDYEYYLETLKPGETPIPFNFFRLQRDSAAGGNPLNVAQNANGEWVIANGAAPTASTTGEAIPVKPGGVNLVGGPTVANAMTLKDATTLTDLNQAQLKLATEQQTAQFAGPQAEANLLGTTQENALKAATAPLVVAQSEADLDATTQATAQAAQMNPLEVSAATTQLEADRFNLTQQLENAPTEQLRTKAVAGLAELTLKEALSAEGLDKTTKELNIKTATLALAEAERKANTERELSATTAKATAIAELNAAGIDFAAIDAAVNQIMKPGAIEEASGFIPGIKKSIGQWISVATDRTDLIAQLKVLAAQNQLTKMEQLAAAGVSLVPFSDADAAMVGASGTMLADPESLSAPVLTAETARMYNLNADLAGGAINNRRFDENGTAYKPDATTLGYSTEGFERNWNRVPPSWKKAWQSGEMTEFPVGGTDMSPELAAIGEDMNSRIANWELYNGEIKDRAIIGASKEEYAAIQQKDLIAARAEVQPLLQQVNMTIDQVLSLDADGYDLLPNEDKAIVDVIQNRLAR